MLYLLRDSFNPGKIPECSDGTASSGGKVYGIPGNLRACTCGTGDNLLRKGSVWGEEAARVDFQACGD